MTTPKELLNILNTIAPPQLAEEWDNVGLLVDADAPAERVLFALDATAAVIEEAQALGCGIIVTHHPVIFSGLKALSAREPAVIAACKGISILSAHTNYDKCDGGVNDVLCALLGVKDPLPAAELGRGGAVAPTTGAALARVVMDKLGIDAVRVVCPEKTVERVAVVGGSGGDLALLAQSEGYDALVTGEVRHHDALAAEQAGMCVIEAGHYATEAPAMAPLMKAVQTALGAGTECILSRAGRDALCIITKE